MLNGAVLAGGLSSRLGMDKASLSLDVRGKDFLANAVGLLTAFCGKVLVIGRGDERFDSVPDAFGRCGPLGGIATALATGKGACLVLSCDMPFMRADVIERLVAARRSRPEGTLATLYRQRDTGHAESLVAVYEQGALPHLERCLAERRLRVSTAIPADRMLFLDYGFEDSLPFFNVNYPADLLLARTVFALQAGSDEA